MSPRHHIRKDNIILTDNAVNRPSTPWEQGIEKMLAHEVPGGYRTQHAETELNDYLSRLLASSEGCGSHAFWKVFGHSSQPGEYFARPTTDRCHGRGHPDCSRDLAEYQLAKHRGRLDAAYPLGTPLVLLRLIAPGDFRPTQLMSSVNRWTRSRPVERMLPPMVGVFGVFPAGYGLTLIAPAVVGEQLGRSWEEAGHGSYECTPITGTTWETLVELKVQSEGGVFELVGSGLLDPGVVRGVVREEIRVKRTKFMGGFLGHNAKSTDRRSADTEAEQPARGNGSSEPDTARDSTRVEMKSEPETLQARIRKAAEMPPTRAAEAVGRLVTLYAEARETGDYRSLREADQAIKLRTSHLEPCPIHQECGLVPIAGRMRLQPLKEAVRTGRATYDDKTDTVSWTEDSWKFWRGGLDKRSHR